MFSVETYKNRRLQLLRKVKSGIILITGNVDSPMNYSDNTYHFRQDSTFLYFFGIDLQNLVGVIDVDNNQEILFGDDLSLDYIIWMGAQPAMPEKAQLVGVKETKPLNSLVSFLQKAINQKREIHFTPPYRAENVLRLSEWLSIPHHQVIEKASLTLINACISMRSIKELCEIEEIEKQMAVGYKMHTTAMKMAHEGISEQEITGALEGISVAGGGMVSFPIICSIHGEILHNHNHSNTLKNGQLLLVDAGCESPLHYATDHTRTTPVGGKFTQQQKDIYQIVLNANNAARKATKPGIPYHDVHFVAARVIAEGLKSLGLMKGDMDRALIEGAHALFFPHGLGHMLGLDVHDMEDYNDTLVGYDEEIQRSTQFGLRSLRLGRRLHPDFVITNEPGVYFIPALIDSWKGQNKLSEYINYSEVEKYRKFGGIRLEDDILVTRSGCRILGDRIPIEIEDVEKIVNFNR